MSRSRAPDKRSTDRHSRAMWLAADGTSPGDLGPPPHGIPDGSVAPGRAGIRRSMPCLPAHRASDNQGLARLPCPASRLPRGDVARRFTWNSRLCLRGFIGSAVRNPKSGCFHANIRRILRRGRLARLVLGPGGSASSRTTSAPRRPPRIGRTSVPTTSSSRTSARSDRRTFLPPTSGGRASPARTTARPAAGPGLRGTADRWSSRSPDCSKPRSWPAPRRHSLPWKTSRGSFAPTTGGTSRPSVTALVSAGYRVGAVMMDARDFVPQARERMILVAVRGETSPTSSLAGARHHARWHTRSLVKAVAASLRPSASIGSGGACRRPRPM